MSGLQVFAKVHTDHGCFHTLCDVAEMTPREWVLEVHGRIERGELLEVVESNSIGKPKASTQGIYDTTPTLITESRTVHLITGELV